jgi:hypothetical protein
MEILQTAISAEGGISKLAQAIGTRPNVISNWHSRGVPKGWQKLLEHKYSRRKKPKQATAPAVIGVAATENVA